MGQTIIYSVSATSRGPLGHPTATDKFAAVIDTVGSPARIDSVW